MTLLDAIILGVIQGFTEFLPVSSSGHLVLAQHLLNVQGDNLSFDVYVHFGTLISVFAYFWKEIVEIMESVVKSLWPLDIKKAYAESDHFRLGLAIVVGSIPAGVVGFLYRDIIKEAFTDPKLVGVNMVVTGLLLFMTRLSTPVQGKHYGILSGFVIGIAQAFAILPGISRSGSTISVAVYLRIPYVRAARFSFLLSIPVIAGAALFESRNLIKEGAHIALLPTIAGTAVAAVTGYLSIKVMLSFLERKRLSWFALYCFVIGVLAIGFIN